MRGKIPQMDDVDTEEPTVAMTKVDMVNDSVCQFLSSVESLESLVDEMCGSAKGANAISQELDSSGMSFDHVWTSIASQLFDQSNRIDSLVARCQGLFFSEETGDDGDEGVDGNPLRRLLHSIESVDRSILSLINFVDGLTDSSIPACPEAAEKEPQSFVYVWSTLPKKLDAFRDELCANTYRIRDVVYGD